MLDPTCHEFKELKKEVESRFEQLRNYGNDGRGLPALGFTKMTVTGALKVINVPLAEGFTSCRDIMQTKYRVNHFLNYRRL